MTTVTWKEGILAADTQLTIDDHVRLYCHKIKHLRKNVVLSCAGPNEDEWKATLHFTKEDWRNLEAPTVSKDFECILIDHGVAYACQGNLYPFPIDHPFYAIGSGWHFALAAMQTGLDAVEAVKFASQLDIYTNNEVEVYKYGQEKKRTKGKETQ